jgi:hypothetical protein
MERTMTLEALAMPLDIPWRRLAYSADMIDRDFDNPSLPPRWRSSVAVFGHAVPMVETEDRYPDARIVYLRLTISITGWSPRLALQPRIRLDEEGQTWRPWIRRASAANRERRVSRRRALPARSPAPAHHRRDRPGP